MKEMTRNDVYELANKRMILKVPYCMADNILKHFVKVGYNSGVYGWNYDIYDCKDVVIVTGYRMAIRGYKVDNELCREYNKEAYEAGYPEEDYMFRNMITDLKYVSFEKEYYSK